MEKDELNLFLAVLTIIIMLLSLVAYFQSRRLDLCWVMIKLQSERINNLRATMGLDEDEFKVETDDAEIEWNPDDEPTGDLDGDSWKRRGE